MTMTTDHMLSQAIALHQAGRRQDAAFLYLAVLRRRADHADAHHNLGLVALQGGDPKTGIAQIRTALAVDPGYGRYWLSHVQALADAGRLDEARRILPWALRLGLDLAWSGALAARLFDARHLLAEAASRHRAGRSPEARTLTRRVLALLPACTEARETLATLAGQDPAGEPLVDPPTGQRKRRRPRRKDAPLGEPVPLVHDDPSPEVVDQVETALAEAVSGGRR